MAWTDPRVVEFKIAAAMGDGLTRNACVGKAKRLGLPDRKRITAKTPSKRKPHQKPKTVFRPHLVQGGRDHKSLRFIQSPELETMPIAELPASEIPLAQRKTFVELKSHHCRWPYGDPGTPEFFFCGDTRQAGCSYCAYHKRASIGRQHVLTKDAA